MKKTEDILERLKGQMPQVPDSDLLTESIMSALTVKRSRIVPIWVNVMRIVSSAAAVLLIALFIGVNNTDQISAAQGVRYSALPGYTQEITDAMNQALAQKWREKRGIEIVSVMINSAVASKEDEELCSKIRQQNVLVIDDVTTSGSTLNEILRTLRILNEDNDITIFSLIGRKDLMAESL